MSTKLLDLVNITKSYDGVTILDDLNLYIRENEFLTLLGPSGCGKTTTLRILGGFETPDAGKVLFNGQDITQLPPNKRQLNTVFQKYALFTHMTIAENIAFGLKIKGKSKAYIDDKIKYALKLVNLEGYENRSPALLSGGQQQRIAIARAIVNEPKVLLLDEPLSAIDAKLRKSLQNSIKQIHKDLGLTCIFVTHDQDEAMVMSDTIHLFHEGRIEQSSDPITMYTSPVSQFAAAFIGNYNILSREQFTSVTGKKIASENGIAIRPETIQIVTDPSEETDYTFDGVIIDNTPKGNVLQYNINVNGVKMKVDVLFRSKVLFENGQKLRLSVADHNCIRI